MTDSTVFRDVIASPERRRQPLPVPLHATLGRWALLGAATIAFGLAALTPGTHEVRAGPTPPHAAPVVQDGLDGGPDVLERRALALNDGRSGGPDVLERRALAVRDAIHPDARHDAPAQVRW